VTRASWILFALAALFIAGSAFAGPADSTAANPGSQPPPAAQTPPPTPPSQPGTMAPPPGVSPATPAASEDPAYAAMRDKAKAATGSQVNGANKNLVTVTKQIDDSAAKDGDTAVATRLASDLGVSSETLVAERSKYGAGWGDLTIAHTLAANATQGATVDQVLQMHTEGIGWGGIASSLGLNVGGVVGAVKEEGKVVAGTAKPDGKAARIAAAPAPKTHAPKEKSASTDGGATPTDGASAPSKDASGK